MKFTGFLYQYSQWVFLSLLLSIASIGAGVGLMGTSAYIIAEAALKPPFAALQIAIVSVRFFGLSRGVFRYLERLVTHSVNLKFLGEIRVWFFRKIEPIFPAQQNFYGTGDLFSRILSDIETMEDFYVRIIAPPVTALMITSGVSIFIGSIHGSFLPVVLSGMVGGGAFTIIIVGSITAWSGRKITTLRGLFSQILKDTIDGSADIHVYGMQGKFRNQFSRIDIGYHDTESHLAFWKSIPSFFSILIPGGMVLGVLWIGLPLLGQSNLSGVLLSVVILIILSSYEAILPLGTAAEIFSSIKMSAERLMLKDVPKGVMVDPEHPVSPALAGRVRIVGLGFQYPTGRDAVLKNIHLELLPGKICALVGPTGSGKSTLTNLLMRFWDINQGNIYLDGVDIQEIALDDVRRYFSILSPSSYIFGDSILGNLKLANPQASLYQINTILKVVKLDQWVESLPDHLDTWIGENGSLISAGQRQRLLIARMLLKGSPVMVFDEPTANLDAITEKLLWMDLKFILRDYAVLWITHKLIHMEEMDEIVFLDHGTILEKGTHQELIKSQRGYHQMWEIQTRIIG